MYTEEDKGHRIEFFKLHVSMSLPVAQPTALNKISCTTKMKFKLNLCM